MISVRSRLVKALSLVGVYHKMDEPFKDALIRHGFSDERIDFVLNLRKSEDIFGVSDLQGMLLFMVQGYPLPPLLLHLDLIGIPKIDSIRGLAALSASEKTALQRMSIISSVAKGTKRTLHAVLAMLSL